MGQVTKTLRERTELPQEAIAALEILTSNWSLLADFALSDLVLWAPTWNDGGMTAVAQIRPTTAPTTLGQDVVGTFAPKGRFHYLDRAEALGQATIVREILEPLSPVGVEAIPVKWNEQVIAVIARHCSGAPLKNALVIGVRRLVTPGPAVAATKPGVRVSRAAASAAKPAVCSLRVSTRAGACGRFSHAS